MSEVAVLNLPQVLSRWREALQGGCATADDALLLLTTAEEQLQFSDGIDTAEWHEWLDATARPSFLTRLPDLQTRERWAGLAFRVIRHSDYSLRTMLERRARSHRDTILFEDVRDRERPALTYGESARYVRQVAGVFLTSVAEEPRVAIFSENCIDSACADLACLTAGILVTPLNVHTDAETLSWIFDRLEINIVVTDSDERQARLAEVSARMGRDLVVFRVGARSGANAIRGLEARSLRQACSAVDVRAIDVLLASRPIDLYATATAMFTSGSTGQAKGLLFSQYMLVTKRFARAAALPAVGDDEVLLCYLPLFHTFGRFFEMLGSMFWGGTYVFAGNPSSDALIAEMGRVRPTGLISVPVRWTQIRDHCLDSEKSERTTEVEHFRSIVGDRLRWGLSAAGYLDPKVFRFFHRHHVDLCSGFGMTEATGGITMTPPGRYADNTVGIPLPGMRVRFGDQGELHIAGPYVAEYLDEERGASLPRLDPDRERWIATGDLFREHANGYLEIVDRIKDIYKNSRGQTIAPQRVEQRFAAVPGIQRTFLAGDHRDHNVLLIVPDESDLLLADRSDEQVNDYFAQIVASVNSGLAPYERVVRFAIVERDFSVEQGELTAKGSFRRRVIEKNFAPVIESLYRSNHVELVVDSLRIRIPRWFFRDLAVLEGDIVVRAGGIYNRRLDLLLRIASSGAETVIVGDIEYRLTGSIVDLGLFARQPRLWLGNAALVRFAPCKPGWDLPLRHVSEQIRRSRGVHRGKATEFASGAAKIEDDRLREIHGLCVEALFGRAADARLAIEHLGEQLARADARIGSAIRRRLEAIAFRSEEDLRALAYRVLLLDVPILDYDRVFPSFLESDRTFLTRESIDYIARARRGERRLQALRQRLHSYRTLLPWPASDVRRRQFKRVFRLLADFARYRPDDFAAVQAELASWALFREDPGLAEAARLHFEALTRWYEGALSDSVPPNHLASREGKVVFEFGIAPDERARLERILFDRTFLLHSTMHAFNERFDWGRVVPEGVWVSPIVAHHHLRLYRLGINLTGGRHYDLLLVVGDPMARRNVRDTILWLTALSGHAIGTPALPRFGAWRRDLGATSVAFINDLTGWDRIRELASQQDIRDGVAMKWAWRKLYVRAMATFFRAWEQSGYRIVPGALTPANVAIPDADFHEGTTILSLAGWSAYDGPLSLVRPMQRSFYRLTGAHYPQSRDILQLGWLFDACVEGLGEEKARRFLAELGADLQARPANGESEALSAALSAYLADLDRQAHLPLPLLCAVERYRDWERMNPAASAEAREEAVIQMIHLYRLERFSDAFRYRVYQHTYFARAGSEVDQAFSKLVARRHKDAHGHLEELSHLQALLADPVDRAVFSRMVFPHAHKTQRLELLALGGGADKRFIVRSAIHDDSGSRYVVREPLSAVEVGHLYRLILETDYPMHIAEQDRQLVIVDEEERIVGGLCYRWQEAAVVYVDGIVIAGALMNQGLGGRLLEDFCVRMAAQGARLVKTNFFLGGLFTKHGFQVNQRWGGLVRLLSAEEGP